MCDNIEIQKTENSQKRMEIQKEEKEEKEKKEKKIVDDNKFVSFSDVLFKVIVKRLEEIALSTNSEQARGIEAALAALVAKSSWCDVSVSKITAHKKKEKDDDDDDDDDDEENSH